MPKKRLSLKKARELNRLDDFISQEEKRDLGSSDLKQFNKALKTLIRPPQSEDQTSRSPSVCDSSGKKTH